MLLELSVFHTLSQDNLVVIYTNEGVEMDHTT